jgi:hypothetical protein
MERYLQLLRNNMADPAWAIRADCPHCDHRILYRAWPAPDAIDGALDAFLDGLATLAQDTGLTAYGLWVLDPPGPAPRQQVWRAHDRKLVATAVGTEVAAELTKHPCPAIPADG